MFLLGLCFDSDLPGRVGPKAQAASNDGQETRDGGRDQEPVTQAPLLLSKLLGLVRNLLGLTRPHGLRFRKPPRVVDLLLALVPLGLLAGCQECLLDYG